MKLSLLLPIAAAFGCIATTESSCVSSQEELIAALSHKNATRVVICPGDLILTEDVVLSDRSLSVVCEGHCTIRMDPEHGIIARNNSFLQIRNVAFDKHIDFRQGPLFQASGEGILLFHSCSFRNLQFWAEAAIQVSESVNLLLVDSKFRGLVNHDGWGGSALRAHQASIVSIRQCTFIDNTACEGNGGALFIEHAENVVIQDSYFGGNYVFDNGGAIYIGEGDVMLLNTTFRNNHAALDNGNIPGHDLYLGSFASTAFCDTHTRTSMNTAVGGGGKSTTCGLTIDS